MAADEPGFEKETEVENRRPWSDAPAGASLGLGRHAHVSPWEA